VWGPGVAIAAGSRTAGSRRWTRQDSLEELTRRTTSPSGRHHFLPPQRLAPLIGPRGTASLLAAFPPGPGASFGGGGEWVHFKRRALPHRPAVRKWLARRSAMRCDGRPLGVLAGRCLPAPRNRPLARVTAAPRRPGRESACSSGSCRRGCPSPCRGWCHLPAAPAGRGDVPRHGTRGGGSLCPRGRRGARRGDAAGWVWGQMAAGQGSAWWHGSCTPPRAGPAPHLKPPLWVTAEPGASPLGHSSAAFPGFVLLLLLPAGSPAGFRHWGWLVPAAVPGTSAQGDACAWHAPFSPPGLTPGRWAHGDELCPWQPSPWRGAGRRAPAFPVRRGGCLLCSGVPHLPPLPPQLSPRGSSSSGQCQARAGGPRSPPPCSRSRRW